jgi:putative cobalt transporter subunit CbtB
MTSTTRPAAIGRRTHLELPDSATTATALWLTATTVIALIAYYFVGIDQGAVSIFGSDTHVHEFFHDARHLLGFPCH